MWYSTIIVYTANNDSVTTKNSLYEKLSDMSWSTKIFNLRFLESVIAVRVHKLKVGETKSL